MLRNTNVFNIFPRYGGEGKLLFKAVAESGPSRVGESLTRRTKLRNKMKKKNERKYRRKREKMRKCSFLAHLRLLVWLQYTPGLRSKLYSISTFLTCIKIKSTHLISLRYVKCSRTFSKIIYKAAKLKV